MKKKANRHSCSTDSLRFPECAPTPPIGRLAFSGTATQQGLAFAGGGTKSVTLVRTREGRFDTRGALRSG
jgi:hypothetical protein